MMTIRELQTTMRSRLNPRYGKGEATALTEIAMEHVFARGKVDLLLSLDKEAGETRAEIIESITERLLGGEPIQYIVGQAVFMGFKLEVNPDVLIPRPETEQLVQLIVDREGSATDLRVLDAGTGSGAIAIALSRNLRFPEITAIDINDKALAVARKNAATLHARVIFRQGDMLSADTLPATPFDIIVSNPPYVMDREKKTMEANVLEHEPAEALFVDDDNPLEFYIALARFAATGGLTDGGRIYYEVNPLTVDALATHMRSTGWSDVNITLDSFGRRRFLDAKLPSDR